MAQTRTFRVTREIVNIQNKYRNKIIPGSRLLQTKIAVCKLGYSHFRTKNVARIWH
jgi:hypothetical protein